MTYTAIRSNSSRTFVQTFLLYAEFTSVALCGSRSVCVASCRNGAIEALACCNYRGGAGGACEVTTRAAGRGFLDVI